ncbi:restriction endonuclease subunit S [Ligilactobacillus murinus]|uniref:restriction endonuclease subunit S n=1 Tax=Ligilactobacillus murinus TaxID=1622 RepID=UPI001C3E3D15|nr:restriction endonuclease subunit S [Ligilactobacillus murinus]
MVEEKKNIPKVRFREFAGDDANAWELRKLGEVAKRYDNLRIPISEGKRERGNIPYYGANGIQDYVKGFTHQGEFVLVAEDGANDVINYPVRYVEGKIWVNNHAHVLQGKKDILDNHFLTYIIKSIKIAPFLVGGSRSKLNSNTMMNMSINVAPFREQQKIGTLFKHLDSLITLHQRELDNYKMLKKTMLSKMFPKNDEKYPEIRFTGFAYAWELRKLGEVAKRYDNLRIPISEGKRERGNIPYYGANGIQDYVKGFTHQGEFVLVAEDGANDVINYPVRYVEGKIWVNNHAHVLQGKKDILDNHFLTYIIKSIKIAPFLVGGSRSKLNSNTMMNMSINVAPFREQQKIGTLFKHLDSLITLHQRELESLKTLKKNLLQQMFV